MPKITKEEFADRVIEQYKKEPRQLCPSDVGLEDADSCVHERLKRICKNCWQQAIKQGVEK